MTKAQLVVGIVQIEHQTPDSEGQLLGNRAELVRDGGTDRSVRRSCGWRRTSPRRSDGRSLSRGRYTGAVPVAQHRRRTSSEGRRRIRTFPADGRFHRLGMSRRRWGTRCSHRVAVSTLPRCTSRHSSRCSSSTLRRRRRSTGCRQNPGGRGGPCSIPRRRCRSPWSACNRCRRGIRHNNPRLRHSCRLASRTAVRPSH